MLICSNENLIYNIYLLIYKAVCIKHIIYQHFTFVLQSGGPLYNEASATSGCLVLSSNVIIQRLD